MLGEKGFNELDMSLLKHLLFNKKPLAFVRTQCDSAISGIRDEQNDEVSSPNHDKLSTSFIKGNGGMTFEEALYKLKKSFNDYIKAEVLSKVDVNDLGEPRKVYL